MGLARWLGCWALVFATGAAWADGGASAGADLKACKGLPAHGKAEVISDDAVYVAGRFLAFPHQEGGGCEVYAVARPTAQAKGRFGTGGQAFAVKASRCAADSCPVAIAVRGKDDRPLGAVRTDVDCDRGVELQPIQLFPDRDDLDLVCRSSAGAGWRERHLLVEVKDGALTPFYLLDTGSYIAVSPAEKRAGATPSCPVGSIKVEKAGDRPLLRVVDPASGTLHDGKGTLPARQMAYDPAHHAVKPTGAPDVPTEVDAHAGCQARGR
jgi:hypothetical protein